ncbi:MAG: endonuclease domain-containing protein [Elainella sp.]
MKPRRIRRNTSDKVAAARRLRKHPTPAEHLLWQAIRERQLNGLKFRRQHPVDAFIADFYCPQRRLIIELDGEIHQHQAEYDGARTQRLQDLGYKVLRFHNSEITSNLEQVLRAILAASQQ